MKSQKIHPLSQFAIEMELVQLCDEDEIGDEFNGLMEAIYTKRIGLWKAEEAINEK